MRTRTNYSLIAKLEVIRRNEKGDSRREISEDMGIPGSTVYDILKHAKQTKALARKEGGHKVPAGKVNGAAAAITTKPKVHSGGEKKSAAPHVSPFTPREQEVLRRNKRGDSGRKISLAMNIPRNNVYAILKRSLKLKAAAERAAAAKSAAEKAAARKVLANKVNMAVIVKENCKDMLADELKQRRKGTPYSLASKLEVVRRYENGEKRCDVSRDMGVPLSTLCEMVKNAAKIKAEAGVADPQDTGESEVNGSAQDSRNIVMDSMERLLKIWIDQQLSQPGRLTDETIQNKAVCLWTFVWNSLAPEETKGLVDNFTASTTWLKHFKESTGFSALPLAVTKPSVVPAHPSPKPSVVPAHPSPKPEVEVLSPVLKKARVPKGFSSLLKAKIEVGHYKPQQVINMSETCLFWKKPPPNTIMSVDEAAQHMAKDQFSLLLGANATGDLKLKPLLVYHLEEPHSLKGYMKECLPVIFRSHPRAKLVSALCQNYVVDYVSQRCKEYAMEHNLQNRFLLLVDHSAAYPPSMDEWADNIEVMFMPTMSKSVVQPMDQGITTAFKLCYVQRLMLQLLRETDAENKESLKRFWQDYNIKKALNNIKIAWEDVVPSTLNTAWHSIWPECVHDSVGQASESEPVEQDMVSLAHQAGLLQVTVQDIQELVKSPTEEMTAQELIQTKFHQDQRAGEEPGVEATKSLDITLLHHVLVLFDEAMEVLEDNDPNCTRSCDARSCVERGIRCYRELFTTKKRKDHNSSTFSPHFK